MSKTYSELIKLPTFEERFEYLSLKGCVGEETFGFDRYLNQVLYHSEEWKSFRRQIILRDDACDLGISDRPIPKGVKLYIHHLNPISSVDIIERRDCIFDPENAITTILSTHNAIHYGDESLLIPSDLAERKPNDMCPWK